MSRHKSSASVSTGVHKMPNFQEKNYEAGKKKIFKENILQHKATIRSETNVRNMWQGV